SAALAAVHDQVRTGNNALAAGEDSVVWQAQLQVRSMLDVLGLDPLAEPWVTGRGTDDAARAALEALVPALLEERAEARRTKDWARADALRDRLQAAGIVIEDSPDGARWQLGWKGQRCWPEAPSVAERCVSRARRRGRRSAAGDSAAAGSRGAAPPRRPPNAPGTRPPPARPPRRSARRRRSGGAALAGLPR